MYWNNYISSSFLNKSCIPFHHKFFCCFLLLGCIFTLNVQRSKTCIQHHIYTIFKKNQFSVLHIYPHAAPTCDTNNKERCFIFHLSGQEDVWIGIGYIDQVLKAPPLSYQAQPCRYWWNMGCMFIRVRYQCMEGMLRISGSVPGAWD